MYDLIKLNITKEKGLRTKTCYFCGKKKYVKINYLKNKTEVTKKYYDVTKEILY